MHLLYCLTLLSVSLPLAWSLALRDAAGMHTGFDVLALSAVTVAGSDGSDRTNDLKVLNLAISLENLVIAFLHVGLASFSEADFRDAGFSSGTRDIYAGMLAHERAHADLLLSTVKSAAFTTIDACEYDFPLTNVQAFVNLSEAIACLSVSTYTGMIGNLTTKSAIGLLASILAVEARQYSWISSLLKRRTLSNTPFETPLPFNYPWSIAKIYVTSCPRSNNPEAVLPPNLKNIPVLNMTAHVTAGRRTRIDFADTLYTQGLPLYAAFRVGNEDIFVPVEVDVDGTRWLTVPQGLTGSGGVWIVIVQNLGEKEEGSLVVSDQNTVSGPALVILPSDAEDGNTTDQNAWSW